MAYYGYHRISTKEQHLDRGIIEIKRFCENQKIKLESIFTDKITGKNFDRPRYTVLVEDVLRVGGYPDYYRAGQTWQEQAGDFKAATFFRRKRGSGNGIGTSYHVV